MKRLIGDLLKERTGLVDELLEAALVMQDVEPGIRLGVALVRIGAVTEEDVAEALAMQLELPYSDLGAASVDPSVAWRVSRGFAERKQVLPMRRERDAIVVAMADPGDSDTVQELESVLGGRIAIVVSTPRSVRRAVERHYSDKAVTSRMLRGVDPTVRELAVSPNYLQLDSRKLHKHLSGKSSEVYIDLVNYLLINAIEREASDIHIEPHSEDVRVRYRIDGMLREQVRLPGYAHKPLVGRIKVVANMDVADNRRAQDGQATVRLGDRDIQLRVSTMPSQHGENVVIRLLDPQMVQVSLAELGWAPRLLKGWYSLVSQPSGLLLVVGPTGSGKSTTLYASIHRLNNEDVSVVTIEDPIEYTLPGITQVAVNPKAGLTFASCIRSMLRQDPNVVVVGEIRDPETAGSAIEAASTGHLVLSTLHTDNALAAVTRLLDLEIPRYLLAAALTGVVSQRLVRVVCPECALPMDSQREDWERLGLPPLSFPETARRPGPGCPSCQYVGYRGRVGIFELLPFTAELKSLIKAGADEADLWDEARTHGLSTLLEDGLKKVSEGRTTLEEIARLVPVLEYPRAFRLKLVEAMGLVAPSAPEEAPEPRVEADAPKVPPEPLQEPTKRSRERPLVLVVDDAAEIRELVILTLEDDFAIRSANDGQEELEMVQELHPDLVVLDVMMPRKTGYELCSELKLSEDFKQLPVLMLSARGSKQHVKQGFYAGADDYLPKPFDPEELLLRARALLRRSGWNLV